MKLTFPIPLLPFCLPFFFQREWNNHLLGIFQVSYIGEKEYVTSTPHLCHHSVKAEDKWVVLSSDGLYQFMGLQDVGARLAWAELSEPLSQPTEFLAREALLRVAEQAGEFWGVGVGGGVGERGERGERGTGEEVGVDKGGQLVVQEES